MIFFIDISDKRTMHLKRQLELQGFKTQEWINQSEQKTSRGDILVCSPAKKWSIGEVNTLPTDIYLFCGIIKEEWTPILEQKGITYTNLLKDEHFAVENAKLTAEGVLALLIENTEKSIFENNILLLGAGRITKSCAMLFAKLGLKFSIATFDKIEYENCYYFTNSNFYAYDFVKEIHTFDVIINTRPQLFIDQDIIQKISPQTLFIETASIDSLDSSQVQNWTFLKAPGLPQRYSCISASNLMLTKILGDLQK